jgi:GNAT superfamily N-acetyltransferase
MTKVSIRRSRDLEKLRELDRELIGKDVPFPKGDNYLWWVAYVDGEIAGYAAIGLFDTEGRYGFLSRAAVLPKFRGQGLQKKLIRVREAEAKRRGYRYFITYTAKWNVKSANSLTSCGYRLYNPAWKYGCANALYFYKDCK